MHPILSGVSVEQPPDKQCHPQNIEDDRHNTQNDGVGWHKDKPLVYKATFWNGRTKLNGGQE
jgi:hypothetical protein